MTLSPLCLRYKWNNKAWIDSTSVHNMVYWTFWDRVLTEMVPGHPRAWRSSLPVHEKYRCTAREVKTLWNSILVAESKYGSLWFQPSWMTLWGFKTSVEQLIADVGEAARELKVERMWLNGWPEKGVAWGLLSVKMLEECWNDSG